MVYRFPEAPDVPNREKACLLSPTLASALCALFIWRHSQFHNSVQEVDSVVPCSSGKYC